MLIGDPHDQQILNNYSLSFQDNQIGQLFNKIQCDLQQGLTRLFSKLFVIYSIITIIVNSISEQKVKVWTVFIVILFISIINLLTNKKYPRFSYWLTNGIIVFLFINNLINIVSTQNENSIDLTLLLIRRYAALMIVVLNYMHYWIVKSIFILSGIILFQCIDSGNNAKQANINTLFFEMILFFIVYVKDKNEKQQFIHSYYQFKQLTLQQDFIDKLIPSSMIVLSRQFCKYPQQPNLKFQSSLMKRYSEVLENFSQSGNRSIQLNPTINAKKFSGIDTAPTMTWEEVNIEYANQKCQDLFKTSELSEIKQKLQSINTYERQTTERTNAYQEKQITQTLLDDIIQEISTGQYHFKNEILYPQQSSSQSSQQGSFSSQQDFEILDIMESKKNFIIEKQFCRAKYAICIWSKKPCILVLFLNESLQKKNNHLQQLNEYKDKLLAAVSHDLKTPLNCIISVTDYLKTSLFQEIQNTPFLSETISQQQNQFVENSGITKSNQLSLFSHSKQRSKSESKQESPKMSELENSDSINQSKELLPQMQRMCSAQDQQRKQSLEYLQLIYNNSIMLLNMINDILDYSKFNSKIKIKPNISSFVLSEVIQEVYDIFSFQVQSKQVKLLQDESNAISLNTDRNRVKQIIMNLVSNSLKFTIQGHIKVSAVENKEQNRIGITVEDTGIGMPEKIKKQLFRDYQTFDQDNLNQNGIVLTFQKNFKNFVDKKIIIIISPSYPLNTQLTNTGQRIQQLITLYVLYKIGIGLGLTICKKFVEMLGEGAGFKVESEEGQGSKFYFEILQNFSNNSNYQNEYDILNFIRDEFGVESPVKKQRDDSRYVNNNTMISNTHKNNSITADLNSNNNTHLNLNHNHDNTSNFDSNILSSNQHKMKDFQNNQFGQTMAQQRKEHFIANNLTKVSSEYNQEEDIPTELAQIDCISSSHAIISRNIISHKVQGQQLFKDILIDKKRKNMKKVNIMIVDDSQYNLITLKLHLKPLNFIQVDEFLFAEEALKQFNLKDYDVVFSDVQMPIMDGIQFVKQIRQKGQAIHQPLVVMVSADTQDKYDSEMQDLSISAFINKPIIDKTKFQNLIHSLVEQL